MSDAPQEVLALDLGGSKLALARVDRQGDLLAHTRTPTAEMEGGDDLVAWVASQVKEWGVAARALGISAGGPLDDERGTIVRWPRMEMLWGYPLTARLRRAMPGLERVSLVNDANAACAGEVLFGAARGLKRVLYLTVSTGVGGGAVVGGRLLRGDRGNSAEFGHMVVEPDGPLCDCGGAGHIEALASAAGLWRRCVEAGLLEEHEHGWAALGPWLGERLEQGDTAVRAIWERGLSALAIGIVNLFNCFAPQAIVIGGGLSTLVQRDVERLRSLIDGRATLMPLPDGVLRFSENRHTIPLLGVAGVAGGWLPVEE